MYNIYDYGWMINDRVRLGAYGRALEQTVKPGSIVLDIGTGSGIMAFMACKLGARKVYAIEMNDLIEVAQRMAAANGYADRLEFIQNMSTRVSLPEQSDVMVSDLKDLLPLYGESLTAIMDARRRLLAPGGTMIPRCETLWAAVVAAPELYSQYVSPWDDNGFSFDMRLARRMALNLWTKCRVRPEQLLVEPKCWATLDYALLESPNVAGEIGWEVTRPGTAHGLAVWFDSDLAPGVGFSNAPGKPELVYHQVYFPWLEQVHLARGDHVSVSLRANLVNGDYLWRWDSNVLSKGDSRLVKASFKQSNFWAKPLSPQKLSKLAPSHQSALNEDGCIDHFILGNMNGSISLENLARQVAERFPRCFANWQEALTRVAMMSERYSL